MIVKSNLDEIENYLNDASNFKGYCEAVYFPNDKYEIKEILKEANGNNTKVTIAGNGTGLTGARVPLGGIVISTERLNKIIEINDEENYAIIQPGITLNYLKNELNHFNLFYPPDPTELNCFIGGNVATNASGARTFKYGPTRNFIEELEIILPSGDEINLKRGREKVQDYLLRININSDKELLIQIPRIKMPNTKNAAGYYCKKNMDALELFIGSEGTLGIVTQIKIKLLKNIKTHFSAIIFFDKEEDGLNFIIDARNLSYHSNTTQSKKLIDASAIEFFDYNSLQFIDRDKIHFKQNANCAVWIEQELFDNEDDVLNEWLNLIKQNNSTEENIFLATSKKDEEMIREFRHSISLKVNEYISKNNFTKLGTDTAVPHNEFLEYYYFCKNIMKKNKLNYVAYGHFGDSHIHLNILPENEEEFLKGIYLYKELCNKAIDLNGTISAEHGVGKSKKNYLIKMYGQDGVEQMFKIKKAFDRNLILGYGNIFNYSE